VLVLRVGLVLLAVGLTISATIECAMTRAPRSLPRWAWLPLIVLLPVVGPLAWFGLGRLRGGEAGGRLRQRRGPVAPDDDPEFLRRLDDEAWRRWARERRNGANGAPEDPGPAPV
jgi:hypothetical protein